MSKKVEIVQGIYDEFYRGEFDEALRSVSPDVVWIEHIPYYGTFVGDHEAIKRMFHKVGERLNWNMNWDRFVDGGDTVVVIGTYTWTVKPSAPDAYEGHARVCHVWTFEGDIVVRYEQFADTAKALQVTEPYS